MTFFGKVQKMAYFCFGKMQIPEVLVLCNDNLSSEGKVRYVPVYMTMFIHKEKTSDVQFRLDLSGL
ncbi:MAG: hypothetical protein ACI3ZQ_03925 [Candidatus Cryptobacteroides sp.]